MLTFSHTLQTNQIQRAFHLTRPEIISADTTESFSESLDKAEHENLHFAT